MSTGVAFTFVTIVLARIVDVSIDSRIASADRIGRRKLAIRGGAGLLGLEDES